jgi:ABC-type branched-subunit amino acid transport system ATPase component
MSGGLVVEDLSVHFGGVYALQSMELTISPGTCVGLTGPNGSGKSTMVNAITGLVQARGHVTINGTSLRLGVPGAAARLGLRRTYQTPRVHAQLTGVENVCTGHPAPEGRNVVGALLRRRRAATVERSRRAAARQALARVGEHRAGDIVGASMSYGQRRLVELARVLVANPSVLLLDEPGAGLNDEETASLETLIGELTSNGIAVLLIDHKVGLLNAVCDHLVVLEQGTKLEEGSPAEVWASPRVRAAYIGQVGDAGA